MYEDTDIIGQTAILNDPYLGYRTATVVAYWPSEYQWEVELSSGKRIFLFDGEFDID